MTCKDFRKYLYAFADGELATKENLEVLEHLNMCPSCSRKVTVQQELRTAVAGLYRDEAAPADLRERVLTGLEKEAARSPWRPVWRVFVPLAAAAVLAVLVLSWPSADDAEAQLVHLVADTHVACCDHLDEHHDARLPRARASVSRMLATEYGFQVIAPQLPGYQFHSANRCGVKGHEGSHLMYKAVSGDRVVSVFSVQPPLALAGEARTRNGSTYRLLESEPHAVVAWNEKDVSHVLCSECGPEELLDLVARTQVARRPEGALTLASHAQPARWP